MDGPNETAPDPSTDLRRVPPVAGWKVAVVLIGIVVGTCLACVLVTFAYLRYLEVRG
jgi:hypothetical protein